MRATRREHAARRQIGQCRHHAGDFLQPAGGALRLATHQRRDAGSRPSARACKDAAGRANSSSTGASSTLRPAYITMTRCAVSATTPRSWVMRMIAVPSLRCRSSDDVEDLRLDGDVERGGRLVGDQHLRIAGQRHGDHGALAHAAGQLMRIFAAPAAAGSGMRTRRSIVDGLLASLLSAHRSRAAAGLRRSGLPIVSTGLSEVIGSWKIIAMSLPRTRAHRFLVEREQIDAAELDRAAGDAAGRIGHQPHQRQRGHAFAAARIRRRSPASHAARAKS